MKDALGRELQVGDEIVYPISYSAHSLALRSARIVEIRPTCLRVEFTGRVASRYGRYGKAVGAFVYKIENVVKIDA